MKYVKWGRFDVCVVDVLGLHIAEYLRFILYDYLTRYELPYLEPGEKQSIVEFERYAPPNPWAIGSKSYNFYVANMPIEIYEAVCSLYVGQDSIYGPQV